MARQSFSDTIRFFRGFILSRPKIDDPSFTDNRTVSADYAALGSSNVLFMGQAKPRPFKGLELTQLVGGVGGTPVGGTYYSGPWALAPAPAGFTLTALGWVDVCSGGHFDEGPLVGGEVTFTNDSSPDTSQGSYGSDTVTTNATLKFRFVSGNGVVGLRYGTPADCALIQDSATDRGIEVYATSGGTSVNMGTRQTGLGWTSDYTDASATSAKVYEIRIVNSVVKFYINSALVATSANNVTGSPLVIWLRLDSLGAKVAISLFRNSS